jgi:hypothetical protein
MSVPPMAVSLYDAGEHDGCCRALKRAASGSASQREEEVISCSRHPEIGKVLKVGKWQKAFHVTRSRPELHRMLRTDVQRGSRRCRDAHEAFEEKSGELAGDDVGERAKPRAPWKDALRSKLETYVRASEDDGG